MPLSHVRPEQQQSLSFVLEGEGPGAFEVEFSDDEGRAYASVALKAEQLLVLRYEPVETGS